MEWMDVMGMNLGGLNGFNSGFNRPASTGASPAAAENTSDTSSQEAKDDFHAQFEGTTMTELLEDALWGKDILEFADKWLGDDEKPVKVRQASGHNMIDYEA